MTPMIPNVISDDDDDDDDDGCCFSFGGGPVDISIHFFNLLSHVQPWHLEGKSTGPASKQELVAGCRKGSAFTNCYLCDCIFSLGQLSNRSLSFESCSFLDRLN